jgi:hypothetical protein
MVSGKWQDAKPILKLNAVQLLAAFQVISEVLDLDFEPADPS